MGDYLPRVQVGNTASLGAGRVPFARYLNAIHDRIHPTFAEILASLDGLPKEHPLSQDIFTSIELVIDAKTGALFGLGIVRPSGVETFDMAALNAVKRSAPFGPAPEVITSPDGRVYVHWDFHRDPHDACGSRNARPYMLVRAP